MRDDVLEAVWKVSGVSCFVKSVNTGYEIQLINESGTAFLRKIASTLEAARNEAEYLRLLLESDRLPSPAAGLKPFALVVEDDPDNCDALSEALKEVGIRALGVGSGLEAVRLAKALGPDLIVIDHRLPDITGAEVCRRLRDDPETEPLPVIAVTGAPDALRADGCVADAILTKPCHLDTFLAAARLFLRPLQAAS